MSELDSPRSLVHGPSGSPSMGPVGGVLLASRSARRTSLLREAGVEHDAAHPGFDDALLEPGGVSPGAWIMSLAYLKAWAKWREVRAGGGKQPRLIIGADTACLVDAELIGTPTTPNEAAGMIRRMAGRGHEVLTGVAIIETATNRRELFVDRASVTIEELPESAIDAYVASGAWKGKAGAYNLSERVEAGWPIRWEGDPTTIMGLPMNALRRRLGESLFGVGASEIG